MSKSSANIWQVSLNLILLFSLCEYFNLKYLDVKLFTYCSNYVVDFKTDAFLTRETELSLAHSSGYEINKLFTYLKFRSSC